MTDLDLIRIPSTDLARICDKAHSEICKGIKAVCNDLCADDEDFRAPFQDEYRLPKNVAIAVITRYDAGDGLAMAARIAELDRIYATPYEAPKTLGEALRVAADQADKADSFRELAETLAAQLYALRNTADEAAKKASRFFAAAANPPRKESPDEAPTGESEKEQGTPSADMVTVSQLAKRMGLTAQKVNTLLEERGYQERWQYRTSTGAKQRRWRMTKKGTTFGFSDNKIIFWSPSITSALEE